MGSSVFWVKKEMMHLSDCPQLILARSLTWPSPVSQELEKMWWKIWASLLGSKNREQTGSVANNPSYIEGRYFSGQLSLVYLKNIEKIDQKTPFSFCYKNLPRPWSIKPKTGILHSLSGKQEALALSSIFHLCLFKISMTLQKWFLVYRWETESLTKGVKWQKWISTYSNV